VLEYLIEKENIDSFQSFLSEFSEMFTDLSTDKYNVALNGHSLQTSYYPESILEDSMLHSQPNQINNSAEKLAEQIQLLSEISIKPRILRKLIAQSALSTDEKESVNAMFD
jgi:hypothetical protein